MAKSGQIEANAKEISLSYKGIVYLRARHPVFAPHFQDEPTLGTPRIRVVRSRHGLTLHYTFLSGVLGSLTVKFVRCADRFEAVAQAYLRKPAVLSHWDVFGGPATPLGA